MNIFEFLSFDFAEFIASTPGILIIIGILFLVVGIVMLMKENKKGNVSADASTVSSTPEQAVETPTAPAVENTATVAPVAETPAVEPVAPVTPVVETPAVAPVVETPVVESLDTPAAVTPKVSQPTVYGGVSPEVLKPEVLEEKPREIYGGANPLENTSPIPNINVSTVAPVAPVVETPAVAPVAPVVETPVVAPVTPVVETPVVAPVAPVVETPVVAPVAPVVETPVVSPVQEEKKEEVERLEF